jgi:hypothetical protein
MLDLMLGADLDALDERGDSALSGHLRECARCRAVARQLHRDTASLTQAVASTSVVSARRVGGRQPAVTARRLAVAGLAAALVAFVARERRNTPIAVAPVVVQSAGNLTSPGLTPASVPAPARTRSERRTRRAPASPPRRGSLLASRSAGTARVLASTAIATNPAAVSVAPVTPLEPVAPVRLLAAPIDSSLGSRVAVDPPAGVRANVMRTSNPGVTVVWLYH